MMASLEKPYGKTVIFYYEYEIDNTQRVKTTLPEQRIVERL